MLPLIVATWIACGDETAANEAPAAAFDVRAELGKIVASIGSSSGPVEVQRAATGPWLEVEIGAVLRRGDRLRTAKASRAEIRFHGVGSAWIGEDGVLALAATTDDRTLAVELEQGVVRTVLGSGTPTRDFVLITKGTSTRLVAMEPESLVRLSAVERGIEVAILEGKVRLEQGEDARRLRAGLASVVSDGILGEPIVLLSYPTVTAPAIDARMVCGNGDVIRMSWKTVAKAVGYELQVARDEDFGELIAAVIVEGTSHEFMPEELGIYHWRVAARDARDITGEFGPPRRIYCQETPAVEGLEAPEIGARFRTANADEMAFRWKPARNASGYLLVIGRGQDPRRRPVVRLKTPDTEVKIRTLGPGQYSWTVYATIGDVEWPVAIAPRSFRVDET